MAWAKERSSGSEHFLADVAAENATLDDWLFAANTFDVEDENA